MTIFIAKVKDGLLSFGSPFNRARFVQWAKENKGKRVRIQPIADEVSSNQRGYYYGAVIPHFRGLIAEWQDLTDDEIHEVLKTNFSPRFTAYDPIHNEKLEFTIPTIFSGQSNHKCAEEFLLKLMDYSLTNYNLPLPDPEEYKRVLHSAKLLGDLST